MELAASGGNIHRRGPHHAGRGAGVFVQVSSLPKSPRKVTTGIPHAGQAAAGRRKEILGSMKKNSHTNTNNCIIRTSLLLLPRYADKDRWTAAATRAPVVLGYMGRSLTNRRLRELFDMSSVRASEWIRNSGHASRLAEH